MGVQGLAMEVSEEGLTPEQRQTLKAIRLRKTEVVAVHRSKKAVANNQATLPRGADRDRKSNTTNMRVRLCPYLPAALHGRINSTMSEHWLLCTSCLHPAGCGNTNSGGVHSMLSAFDYRSNS